MDFFLDFNYFYFLNPNPTYLNTKPSALTISFLSIFDMTTRVARLLEFFLFFKRCGGLL